MASSHWSAPWPRPRLLLARPAALASCIGGGGEFRPAIGSAPVTWSRGCVRREREDEIWIMVDISHVARFQCQDWWCLGHGLEFAEIWILYLTPLTPSSLSHTTSLPPLPPPVTSLIFSTDIFHCITVPSPFLFSLSTNPFCPVAFDPFSP
jgi:hypothetical protein